MKEYEVRLPRLASQGDDIVAVSSSLIFNRGRLFQTYQIAATILAHRRSEAAKKGTNAAVRYLLARVSTQTTRHQIIEAQSLPLPRSFQPLVQPQRGDTSLALGERGEPLASQA